MVDSGGLGETSPTRVVIDELVEVVFESLQTRHRPSKQIHSVEHSL